LLDFAACRSNALVAFLFARSLMSVESELVWLRIMAQVRREDVIVDRLRAAT
jgi:hypothetical protein